MGTVKRRMRTAVAETFGEQTAERLAVTLQKSVGAARRWYSPALRASNAELSNLENRHAGQRVVLMGNGPSLNQTDFELIRDEQLICLNRGYLKLDQLGRTPDLLVCVNKYVIRQFGDEMSAVDCPRFTTLQARNGLRPEVRSGWTLLQSLPGPFFAEDPRLGVWEGATVTYVAMQLAFFLGFRHVVLIGVDHRFSTTGPAHLSVVSDGPDPNHFDPSYFGAGTTWQLPDLETSEIAYRLARERFERAGRSIVDATTDGSLRVFPRVPLREAVAYPP